MDLIGLPPSPAEAAEFLADNFPDAWKKLIDKLLASPHYGERWGRHWLDVARYADSNGLDENAGFLELRYLDADDVDLGLAYDDIAPLLWLRAGAQGFIAPRVDEAGNPLPYAWTERYGVLFDEDRWRAFVSACPETARAAFIVTNSPTTFAGIAADLPSALDTVRLYDTYLSMFLPERGRA
jgi:hypothetical protein